MEDCDSGSFMQGRLSFYHLLSLSQPYSAAPCRKLTKSLYLSSAAGGPEAYGVLVATNEIVLLILMFTKSSLISGQTGIHLS